MMKVVILSTERGEETALLNDVSLFSGEIVKSDIIELRELISTLVETVAGSIRGDSKLRIEVAGTVKIKKSKSGEKVVCFNVTDDANSEEQNSSVRLVLETPVSPEQA